MAIVSVFIFHYAKSGGPEWAHAVGPYGWAGVDLFFVLSGFLIGCQVFAQLTQGRFSFGQFYLRRAFRILPAYWVVLALYFVFPILIERSFLQPVWRYLTFTMNLGLDFGQGAAFSHAWSLCVEEHFYLLFPVIAWALTREGSTRRSVLGVIGLIMAGVVLRGWAWAHFIRPLVEPIVQPGWGGVFLKNIYYPTYQRLDGLVIGAALSALAVYRSETWSKLQKHSKMFFALGLTSLVWVYWAESTKQELLPTAIAYPLIAASFGCWVTAAANEQAWLNRIRVPLIRWGATLSYSFYLVHKQVIHVVLLMGERYGYKQDSVLLLVISFVLSLLLAITLYLCVERPFLRLRSWLLIREQSRVA